VEIQWDGSVIKCGLFLLGLKKKLKCVLTEARILRAINA
jgi:hypothetical protein